MKQLPAFILTVLAAVLLFTITPQTDLLAATPFSEQPSPHKAKASNDLAHIVPEVADTLAPHDDPDTTGTWTQANDDGFDHPGVISILAVETYQDYLYVGTDSRAGGINRLMRSMDGTNWEEVIEGDSGRIYNYAIADLVEFQGKLFLGTWHWNLDDEISDGGEVWRSDDGLAWNPVVTDGFGIPSNNGISRFSVFKGQLYAFTATFTKGGQMQFWKTATGNPGEWQQVPGGPFANPDNTQAATVEIFQDRLYLGTQNDVTGGELWRTQDGATWEKITLNGLDSAKTSAIASMEILDGQLYLSTRNLDGGGEIWRSADGVNWVRVAAGGLGDPNNGRLYNLTNWNQQLYVLAGNLKTGAEVWQSDDGVAWNKLTDGGWGDINNVSSNFDEAALPFNDHLYFGATNTKSGAELWRYNTASTGKKVFLPLSLR